MTMHTMKLFALAAVAGLQAAAAQVAVLENPQKAAKEFDDGFAKLGVETEKFGDTDEEIARFVGKIDGFSLAISGPLFTYQKHPKFDAGAIRAWIEKGGVLFMTDGSYGNSRDFLKAIDGSLGGLESGKCTSSQWAVLGYTSPIEPVHPLRMFPNRLSCGDSWPHFEPVAEGSKWRAILNCSEGKPVTYVQELGKGAVVTTCLRHRDAHTLENLMAYVTLRKAGMNVTGFSITEDRPGPGRIELTFRDEVAAGAALVYELTQTNGAKVAFDVPVRGKSAAADFNISLRGETEFALYLDANGSRNRLFSHRGVLPPLLEVGPNAYRGILSSSRRVKEVAFPVRFAPDREKLGGAEVTLAAYAPTGVVAETAFKLPEGYAGGEEWVKLPLAASLTTGWYRVEAKLPAFGATAGAAFEIRAPRLAQCVIDDDNTFLVNGKPFFPLGIYHIEPKYYEKAGEIGFNTVQFWAWHGQLDAYGSATYMFKALGNGIRCLYAANHVKEPILRRTAREHRDNPGLLMWYVVDEPDEGQASWNHMINDTWHEEDRDHPTFVASCRTDLFARHAQYADVFAMDPYGGEAKMVEWCKKAQAAVGAHKPVIAIPWADMSQDTDLIPLQAWTAIAHDARGIIWYCWKQMGGGPLGVGIHSNEVEQAVYKKLIGDIKKVVPALTSPVRRTFEIGSVHGIVCGDKPRAHALVMVNTSETETVEVDIRPPEMKHLKAVRHPLEPPEPFKYAWGTRMEDPVREIEKGRVQHTFKPREVLVWRW